MRDLVMRANAVHIIDPAPAISAPACDLRTILKSIRQLALADRAAIIRRDDWASEVTVVGRCTSGEASLPAACSAMVLPTPGESRWVDGNPMRSDRVMLLAGLSCSDGARARTALLLTYENGVRPLHAAAEGMIPALCAMAEAHLAQAARLHVAEQQQRAAMAALQQTECGVVVLGPDRSILLSNDAADALLAGHNGLSLHAGTLRPTSYHDALRFNTAVDCVADQASDGRNLRGEAIVMLLPRPTSARALIAVITPAPACSAAEATAIVYLLSPDKNAVRGVAPICAAHGLSQVETRLVTHLVEGFSISDAAAEMRIKPATARGYLKNVFAKTGMHRQVDLVQLLLRYLRAVRGDFDFQAG